VEPVTPEWVAKVIERERPDALLPTMGGQTALNVAMALHEDGTLERYGVELIGANARAIRMAEDRREFANAMERIGLAVPTGRMVANREDAFEVVEITGYPSVRSPCLRPTARWSSSPSSGGRSSSWRSCATDSTTS
jgi:carbamoyl-phosphate synthase large subunit